ncbi:MAG: NAD(P)/FAD-dependent oxidoreductase, partial [Solirubrobacterales bacterium]|nr:NAD(P)/FAD-dependent oxidoreductase [Solirubrobacterales bacterium]
AEALAEVRRIPGAAEAVNGELDVQAALARRDEVIHDLDDSGQLPWLQSRGIALVRADGRLEGELRVRAGDEVLVARKAVIVATGTSASLPPVDGLAGVEPWTNRQAAVAEDVPRRLVVLGGGVVGVEMAQAYATLGSEVALLEVGPRLLGREEDFAAEQVADGLRAAGVDVRTGARVTSARRDGTEVLLELAGADPVAGDELLVAAGRRPRTEDIGAESVGLTPGEPIVVGDRLHDPGRPWLYAIGDVNGRALLTHQGKEQARIAADHILGRDPSPAVLDGALSPRVIFTEPQVAAVGHTTASAREAGIGARAVDSDMNATAGASFYGKGVTGTARIVVDEGRGVLVGATFTGADVAELLHAATIAIVGEVPMDSLWHAVPSFPTRSEVWLKLLQEYGL